MLDDLKENIAQETGTKMFPPDLTLREQVILIGNGNFQFVDKFWSQGIL